MTIEEAIHQKKFDNEYEKLVINILFTASWLEGKNIQRFKPFGISPQQFNVLRILRGSYPNPVRLSDITERMIDKNSNATRLVEKLRQKGLLKRDICPTNRRQVDILILNKGLEILKEIDVEMKIGLKEFNTITKSDAKEMNALLDKLRS
jgi:DNA-binding MarR family transcriptional regulator